MSEKAFEGIVKVYNEEFYLNTETGAGIEGILKKIDPLLCKMASKTYISGYGFDDIKQELVLIAIDGMRSYDPARATTLSTFLQTHLKYKLISKLKSVNKMSNDAFGLYGKEASEAKIQRVREELSFSQCTGDDKDGMFFEQNISSDGGIYNSGIATYDDLDFIMSLERITEPLDEDTTEIIRLMYYEDFSIKDAAKKVDLTGWAASMRLRNLAKKKSFKDVFSDLRDG